MKITKTKTTKTMTTQTMRGNGDNEDEDNEDERTFTAFVISQAPSALTNVGLTPMMFWTKAKMGSQATLTSWLDRAMWVS